MSTPKPFIAAGIVVGFACNVAVAQVVAERAGLMTNPQGHTLYMFDKDSSGKSVCNGSCAAAWPPFMAKDDAKGNGRLTIVMRDDGGKQWAVDGKPLYFFAADAQPGDVKGDGQGGVWHVIKQRTSNPATSFWGYGSYMSDPYSYSGQ